MTQTAKTRLMKLFSISMPPDDAKEAVEILNENAEPVEELVKKVTALSTKVEVIEAKIATKDDIIAVMAKIDSARTWTVGFIGVLIGLALALAKIMFP